MKHLAIYSALFTVLFFFPTSALSGQKTCDCPLYPVLNNDIRNLFYADMRDENEVKRMSMLLLNDAKEVCKAKGYAFLAEAHLCKKQLDSVDYYLQRSTAVLQKNACTEAAFYDNYRLSGTLFYQKLNYNEAIAFGYKALAIAENEQNIEKQAETLTAISRIFTRLQQYDKALEYSRRALPFIQKLPPSVLRAILLEMLTQNYNSNRQVATSNFYVETLKKHAPAEAENITLQFAKTDKYLDTIRLFTTESKALAQRFNHKATLIKVFRHLQTVATSLDNDEMALRYIDSSLMYCEPGVDDSGLFVGYGDKADIYWKLKNPRLATQFADSCLFYAQKIGVPTAIANAYLTKSDIAAYSENWKDAFYALREVKVIMDSVQNTERTKVVNELEKKYNQAKNEKTIKELAQEKRIYLLLALAALLGIVIFLFYLRHQQFKHKQMIMETEQRLNRARMNPHFFFNALTSLQSFALRENDGKTLASNLSKFSHIMRETLESSYKEYVTIEQEIEFLNEYLEIQKIRFPKKFSYHIEAHDDLEIDELMIPSMILQPFVENSIEHGFAGLEHEGHVDVYFKKDNTEILIEISDNGKGLSMPQKISGEHISRASQIIKDRIYLLNIKLKTKARFSIDNQVGGNGVLVKICLPIILQHESISS